MNAPDPVKLEALLTERAGVRRLVRGLLRDEHDVDDVVQDTWLTAIQNPPEAGRDPRPWLARVARNLALKRVRSEARRTTRERRAARPEPVPPSAGIVERARTHRQVVDAVLALDEPCRTTILLRFFEGRPPRRIARETGVSVNTVNSRIQRGLVRLRRKLSRDLGVERSALGLALLPLIQTPKGLLMGALIMGAKAKIGLTTALVLVAAVAVYQLSDGEVQHTKPTPPESPARLAAEFKTEPQATTTEPPAKVAAATTADAPHPDASPAPAAPIDKQETISGTVRSLAGVPLAGATVCATSPRSPLVRFTLEKPLTTTTDALGCFSFTALDTRLRALVVEASVPGYFGQRRVVRLGESYDFVLGAPGTVRGRITSTRDGSPCANATVGVAGTSPRRSRNTARARTNQDGVYCIQDLEPGVYRLSAHAPDHASMRDAPRVVVRSGRETVADLTLDPGRSARGRVLSGRDGKPVAGVKVSALFARVSTVTDKDGRYRLTGLRDRLTLRIRAENHAFHEERFRFRLDEDEMEVADVILKPVSVVRGQVLDPDRKPVPGAEVKGGVKSVFTDETGRFELTAARFEKPLQLEARKTGLSPTLGEPLSIEPGTTRSGVVIRMGRGGQVSGRVVDDGGAPVIRNVAVRLESFRRSVRWSETVSAAPDGSFRFQAVPAGRYKLVTYDRNGERVGHCIPGLVVTEGGALDGLQAIVRDGTTISGRVVDEVGRPVPGARVRFRCHEHPAIPGFRQGVADENGGFSISGLVPGEHSVTAEAEGRRQMEDVFTVGGATDVVVRLALVPPPLEGVVLLKDARTPVTSFWVRVDSHRQRFIDPEGRFRLELRKGAYQVEAGTEDGLVSEGAFDVKLGRGTPPLLELLLVPGASLTGTVRQPDGTPASEASVEAVAADETRGIAVAQTVTDRDGRFVLTALRPGPLLLTASHRDWFQTTRPVVVSVGSPATQDLTLAERGARLRVEVKTAEGKPVERAHVQVMTEQGRTLQVAQEKYRPLYQALQASRPDLTFADYLRALYITDSHGVLTRRFLPAGRCRVEVTRRGYRPGQGRAELFPDRESSLIVVLEEVP